MLADGWLPGVAQAPSGNHGGTLHARLTLMHYTGGHSAAGSLAWMRTPASKVSAHALVSDTGAVTQLVPWNLIAWHAGHSAWTCEDGTKLVSLNLSSIGIELDYDGPVSRVNGKFIGRRVYEPVEIIMAHGRFWPVYPEAQIQAAAALVRAFWAAGACSTREITGHENVAPGRKMDPGPAFPWTRFRELTAQA